MGFKEQEIRNFYKETKKLNNFQLTLFQTKINEILIFLA
jgi:hypothetical protein